MKFYKRLPLDQKDPMSNKFVVLADDEIVTNTRVAFTIPKGGNGDRPGAYNDGMVRYNLDLQEFEVYNGSGYGQGWEKIRTVRPGNITVQRLGPGDGVNTDFGALRYSSGEYYTSAINPQNVLVFIENVFQIPTTNYVLFQNGNDQNRVWLRFSSPPPLDITQPKYITVLLGYDGYFPPFPAP